MALIHIVLFVVVLVFVILSKVTKTDTHCVLVYCFFLWFTMVLLLVLEISLLVVMIAVGFQDGGFIYSAFKQEEILIEQVS